MNAVYLRRRSCVLMPEPTGSTPDNVLATFQRNVEALGFRLAPEVTDALRRLAPADVTAFYHSLVADLRELVGAHRPFVPFYPGFPAQVMNLTEAERYFNALRHYLTHERPTFPPADRPALAEETAFRVVRLGSRDDFEDVFTKLARSKSPFSPADRADVGRFVGASRDDIRRLLPDAVPCRENLAVLGAELARHTSFAADWLAGHARTATDALRLAAALCDGDVSLAAPCRFTRLRRRDRELLLGLIDRAAGREEDMRRRPERWKRLGERLHPGEYAGRYPHAAAAFDALRNGRLPPSFAGRVEAGLRRGDTAGVLDLLAERPGELARRLDHLARIAGDPAAVIARFGACAGRVATPVLLQAMTHFRRRDEPASLRAFFPKGQVASVFAAEKPLPPLPAGVAGSLADVCERALLARFAALPPLGRCRLDPRLRSYLVPFSQRSAAKSLRTLVRGSRLPLPPCGTLRFFVWWKNGRDRTDLDLSAAMFDADFRFVDLLAYHNLTAFGAVHSGDIVDAPEGAAEFIDIDLARCVARGVRHVVMCVNNFTRQPFCDLPECFAGWMARREAGSGEVFEPRTVVDKVDIASATRFCLPAMFDLFGRQVLWADVALRHHPRFVNNVAGNLRGVSLMLRALDGLRKPDLHTLFGLHARSRGGLADAGPADTMFTADPAGPGLTPFDLDRIAADYL